MLILAQIFPPESIGHGCTIFIYDGEVIIKHPTRHDVFFPRIACEWYARDQDILVMAVTDYTQPGFLSVHQLDLATGVMSVQSIPNTSRDIHIYLQSVVPGETQRSISSIGVPNIPLLPMLSLMLVVGVAAFIFILVIARIRSNQKLLRMRSR